MRIARSARARVSRRPRGVMRSPANSSSNGVFAHEYAVRIARVRAERLAVAESAPQVETDSLVLKVSRFEKKSTTTVFLPTFLEKGEQSLTPSSAARRWVHVHALDSEPCSCRSSRRRKPTRERSTLAIVRRSGGRYRGACAAGRMASPTAGASGLHRRMSLRGAALVKSAPAITEPCRSRRARNALSSGAPRTAERQCVPRPAGPH